MITFHQGNLLEAPVEALVNTVNTVGVMGKGIALMFKEAFPSNFQVYEEACKRKEVRVGQMFVTENRALNGPRWLINFARKKHWRQPSKLEWIVEGLKDLRRVIEEKQIASVALPPVGCGNGGLDWRDVRLEIERILGTLDGVEVFVFDPTPKYQNAAKLTPARALVTEMVRRYWVLGIECTHLELQKLCWFLERTIRNLGVEDPLDLRFVADRYGPYSDRPRHLPNGLNGSYLHCDKRLSDAGPSDTIWFDEARWAYLELYLKQKDHRALQDVLDRATTSIDGFESPFGMELLATVDWLIEQEDCEANLPALRAGLGRWPAGAEAGERKLRTFNDQLVGLALERITAQ